MLLFALARLGAILVPLNWRLTAAEHKAILADCTPKWIFSMRISQRMPALLDVPEIQQAWNNSESEGADGDDVLVVYTSGTTGKPRVRC
mgnify:CR=1 FL=1